MYKRKLKSLTVVILSLVIASVSKAIIISNNGSIEYGKAIANKLFANSVGQICFKDGEQTNIPAAILNSRHAISLLKNPEKAVSIEFNNKKYLITDIIIQAVSKKQVETAQGNKYAVFAVSEEFENTQPFIVYNNFLDDTSIKDIVTKGSKECTSAFIAGFGPHYTLDQYKHHSNKNIESTGSEGLLAVPTCMWSPTNDLKKTALSAMNFGLVCPVSCPSETKCETLSKHCKQAFRGVIQPGESGLLVRESIDRPNNFELLAFSEENKSNRISDLSNNSSPWSYFSGFTMVPQSNMNYEDDPINSTLGFDSAGLIEEFWKEHNHDKTTSWVQRMKELFYTMTSNIDKSSVIIDSQVILTTKNFNEDINSAIRGIKIEIKEGSEYFYDYYLIKKRVTNNEGNLSLLFLDRPILINSPKYKSLQRVRIKDTEFLKELRREKLNQLLEDKRKKRASQDEDDLLQVLKASKIGQEDKNVHFKEPEKEDAKKKKGKATNDDFDANKITKKKKKKLQEKQKELKHERKKSATKGQHLKKDDKMLVRDAHAPIKTHVQIGSFAIIQGKNKTVDYFYNFKKFLKNNQEPLSPDTQKWIDSEILRNALEAESN